MATAVGCVTLKAAAAVTVALKAVKAVKAAVTEALKAQTED